MNHLNSQLILFLSALITGVVFMKLSVKDKKIYKNLLSFSGAFLFGLTVLHFMPEVFAEYKSGYGVAILLGFCFQIFLEFLTQGLDHGHYHEGEGHHHGLKWSAVIGLFAHSLFEATPISAHDHGHHGHDHGEYEDYFLWGLVLHKITVAIFLGTIIGRMFKNKWKGYLLLTLFALMAPIGILITDSFESLQQYHNYFMGFVIGIFLYISTTILYEINENHNFNTVKFISIVVGFLAAVATSL